MDLLGDAGEDGMMDWILLAQDGNQWRALLSARVKQSFGFRKWQRERFKQL
jgi:hypothetical protein